MMNSRRATSAPQQQTLERRHDSRGSEEASGGRVPLASERWLTAGSGGNISVRIPSSDRYLCTATGVTFRDTAVENVIEMDLAGNQRGGDGKPSKEYRWHAGVLALRPEVHGVVHTHSTRDHGLRHRRHDAASHDRSGARALWAGSRSCRTPTPGSEKLRDLVVEVYRAFPETRIVLLANHGLAATGPDASSRRTTAPRSSRTRRRRSSTASSSGASPTSTSERRAAAQPAGASRSATSLLLCETGEEGLVLRDQRRERRSRADACEPACQGRKRGAVHLDPA